MESNLLLAIFVLLAVTVILVPLAKISGLGTILGYLAAGVLIGPYGLRLVSDTDIIRSVSEFGVVMMLFLIGLELQPRELWRLRYKMAGLGLTQMIVTAAILAVMLFAFGLAWPAAVIAGLGLAMSSTAIAMQSVAQRSITRTATGRASLAILLVQDVAVIAVLAAIPFLAALDGSPAGVGEELADAVEAIENPADWLTALLIVGGFVAAVAAGRFLVRPLIHFVAHSGVSEAFTALGLALVIGAALLTQYLGVSPALGAFLGGVLLADSEYRHELESNLEPFKGLLLGLFFISVGMSIAFSVVLEQPVPVLSLVAALVGIKMAVLFGLATIFRMHVADRLLLTILLSQAGEFAFVIVQFAQSAGAFSASEAALLTVVVALSMATTPLLIFVFDKLVAPRLNAAKSPANAEAIVGGHRVIVLGYGRFGQIVTRLLRSQGLEMTLIDDDPAQIATVKRFGVKVFYGDAARLEILRSAGAAEAEMIFITTPGRERINTIAELIKRHFPRVKIAARALDRSHAHELMALGVDIFERETFRSALTLGTKALVALGYAEAEAARLAESFEQHDSRLLQESFALRHDEDAYIGFVRQSVEMLGEVMQADTADAARMIERGVDANAVETDPEHQPDIDKKTAAGSE